MKVEDYQCEEENMWCPGCGNFGLQTALFKTLAKLELPPHKLAIIGGIGQAPKFTHYIKGNAFDGLHGRALTAAVGVSLANPKLNVIAFDGDGGAFGEGLNHFMQNIRRNVDLTYIVTNNQVFGLTKGQPSPTAEQDLITKLTPKGLVYPPFNPVLMALANAGSFVARIYVGNIDHSVRVLKQALNHRGMAFIDVLQPCVSFAKEKAYKYYKGKVYELEGTDYDVNDKEQAFAKAREWGSKIPIGIFWKEERPLFREQYPMLKDAGELWKNTPKTEVLRKFLSDFY